MSALPSKVVSEMVKAKLLISTEDIVKVGLVLMAGMLAERRDPAANSRGADIENGCRGVDGGWERP
jgi:hypothetical protein